MKRLSTTGEARSRRFLILHGWQNHRPADHWQHWLAGALTATGGVVSYPQLPNPDQPVLKDWLAELDVHLATDDGSERVVICHSLGCMAWMHFAAQGSIRLPVDRILLVAPPSEGFLESEPALTEFLPLDNGGAVTASSRLAPRLVCSDNDPYCPEGAWRSYPAIIDVDVIPGARHLDVDAGYQEWPSLLGWCRDARTRVTGVSPA